MKIRVFVELKNGYTECNPLADNPIIDEIHLTIDARNMVTAGRMVKAMFKGNENILSVDYVCESED